MTRAEVCAVSYDLAGAIEACGLSETTIREAIKDGSLLAHYAGRRPVIIRDDLRDWIESLPTERRSA